MPCALHALNHWLADASANEPTGNVPPVTAPQRRLPVHRQNASASHQSTQRTGNVAFVVGAKSVESQPVPPSIVDGANVALPEHAAWVLVACPESRKAL